MADKAPNQVTLYNSNQKLMKNISISEKLILYFVTAGIIVIIIIGSITYHITKQALIDRTFDQLISLRLEKTNQMESFFHDRKAEVIQLINSHDIQEHIQILENNYKPGSSDVFFDLCRSRINTRYFQDIQLFVPEIGFMKQDSSGNTSLSETELSGDFRKFFLSSIDEKNLSVKAIFLDIQPGKLSLFLASRIPESQSILILEIPHQVINNIMVSQTPDNGLGRSGETYLVGNDYLMRSSSRFMDDAVLKQKVTSEAVQRALNGETGTAIILDYRNIRCLSSFGKVKSDDFSWMILAEMDFSEAMKPVDSIRNSILLISVLIASAIFLFAFLVARKIILPLKRLQKASEQIGEGNFEIHLKVTSTDEIGSLTETFNQMSQQLVAQKKEIEDEKTKRFSSLIDGQEMERQRLSRDLHDSLGQSLLAVNLKLEQTNNQESSQKQQTIDQTRELLKSTIQEIRQISSDLMPPVLQAFGIEQALHNLCRETSSHTTTEFSFRSQDIPQNLDKRIQIYLYRIAQEAINNIVKHASATKASVTMYDFENFVFLTFTDNGNGFDMQKMNVSGNGLTNIRQRVDLLDGECNLQSTPGNGTRISIKIPMKS
jgi:signal transduction histidine kinase